MSYTPRDYQTRALDRVYGSFVGGRKRVLLTIPTGGGKTVVACLMMRDSVDRGRHVVFLAHRKELVTQAVDKLRLFGVDPGVVIEGKHYPGRDTVTVAVIQSLAMATNMPRCDDLIVDEAHTQHALRVVESLRADRVVGLTATPIRQNGCALGNEYDELIVGATMSELLSLGVVVPPRAYVPSLVDLTGVGGADEYDVDQLAELMLQPRIVGDVVASSVERCPPGLALVFAVNRRHAEELNAGFLEAGLRSEVVLGTTQSDKRDRIICAARAGELDRLVNVSVCAEGLDIPEAASVIDAQPTKSLARYLQKHGRGCRAAPGKSSYVYLDHAGNWAAHGNPSLDIAWALKRSLNDKPKIVETYFRCSGCYAIWPKRQTCDFCGTVPESRARLVAMVNGRLVEVDDGYAEQAARFAEAERVKKFRRQQYMIGRKVAGLTGDKLNAWVQKRIERAPGAK